ncbi:hypothetical protein B296_00049081 [Ensete ventricosum]|uniref:Uncharacterized protein n=1 Tax=Ensete ventricosum TaxID=4639 RepID=A0A426X0U0_ENSVE|nr:hypothetical protein B296_00049081 [Ensete ventricosum]
MLQRAHQYMTTETLVAGKREETKRPGGSSPVDIPRHRQRGGKTGRTCCHPDPPNSPQFNSNRDLLQIRERGLLKVPSPMKSHLERRDRRRYYHFHREYRHDTEEYRDLQYQIEDLIRRGHLRRYVREQPSLPDC